MFLASVKEMPFVRGSVTDISKSFVQRILRTSLTDRHIQHPAGTRKKGLYLKLHFVSK